MDDFEVKSKFIGFKCTPWLWRRLSDACDRNGLTLSKLIYRILVDWSRYQEVQE